VKSPHQANIVAAFTVAAMAILRSTAGSRSTSAMPAWKAPWPCWPTWRSFHRWDSGTALRIQSVSSAGRIPTKNTARQPNRGSTSAVTTAATA